MDSGTARSRRVGGGVHFSEKSGHFRIFAWQIFGLPPPFGHPPPLINAGGKIMGFHNIHEGACCKLILQHAPLARLQAIFFDCNSGTVPVVGLGDHIGGGLDEVRGVAHGHAEACGPEDALVIAAVAQGHGVLCRDV